MDHIKNPAEAQIIAHLSDIAEATLKDFGIPKHLRDGTVHHNGCEWTGYLVYAIVRKDGQWTLSHTYETPKAIFLLEMSSEACAAGRAALDSYNALCIGPEAYAKVCNNTFVTKQAAQLAA
jgi:hypothetical protein